MKSFKILLISSILTLSLSAIAQAQGPPPPPGSANPTPFGFVEILIGAGAVYGAKKAYDKKKTNEEG